MRCPYCGSRQTKTVDSRTVGRDRRRRRYECYDCKERFTTYEYHEEDSGAFDALVTREEKRKEIFNQIIELAQTGRK